ncbi:MAG: ABC transporter permease [Wenzhouxiangellaceae bacterium]|nr:ABC transporter permease [Wenzhouxiangellaceae bacterium]
MLLRISHAFFRRHPAQLLLAVIGIAAGIAVVTGVALLRGALLESLDAASAELAGEQALAVRHPSGKLPIESYARLARQPGAPDFVPVLRLPVRADGQRLEVLGVDPFSGFGAVSSALGPDLAGALLESAQDLPAVMATRATLDLVGVDVGDSIEIQYRGEAVRVQVAASLQGVAGLDRRLLMDIARAQSTFGVRGWVSELLAPAGAGQWLQANAGDELTWQTGQQRRASARQLTEGMRANLTAMSLLALATGLFVVYSVLSFLMVQRLRTFGLLRAIGLTHRGLAQMLLLEALLLASIGGLIGLVAGTLLSDQLLALIADPVGEIYGQLPLARSQPNMWLYAAIWLAGLAAAVVVTVPILREALGVSPGRLARSHQLRPVPVARLLLISLALGAAGLLWILLDARLVAALGGLFLLLAGLILLLPAAGFGLLSRLSSRYVSTLGGRALKLLQAARGRLSPALASLSLALALAIGMGMMILDFRGAVDDWVQKLLRADLYVSASGRALTPDEKDQLTSLEPVRTHSSVRRRQLADGLQITAYDLPAEGWQGFEWLRGEPRAARRAFEAGDAVLVSEPLARREDLSPGDRIELTLPDGKTTLPIAAVFRDYGSNRGYVAVADEAYRSWFDDDLFDSLGLYLAAGSDTDQLIGALEALELDRQLSWVTPAAIRDESLAVFDRTFRISWALAVLVGAIALIALTSALLAQGLERAREYATLRALGMTPMQLFGLVTIQTTGLTGAAVLLAVPLAVVIHYSLAFVIQPRAFGWSVPLSLPPAGPILWVAPLALLLGAAVGMIPAWRIVRRPPIDHLRAGQ